MRFLLTLALVFTYLTSIAQTKNLLYGNWIKTRLTYQSGKELTDDDTRKFEYLKFSFSQDGKFALAYNYDYKGGSFRFVLNGDTLQYGANLVHIDKLTKDSLVFTQWINGKFDNPNCLKYYFVAEPAYQKAIPLTANDIVSINQTDTLYRASEKIYAGFKEDEGFRQLVSDAVKGLQQQTPINDHFLATFTINKAGEALGLQIISGINREFDRQFNKVFERNKKKWVPATYKGKAVNVQMKTEIRFTNYSKYPVYQRYTQIGTDAMYQGDFNLALFNFDKALKNYAEGDIYYKMALCQIMLGNIEEACSDMLKSEALDYTAATGLKRKYCH
jgi:tetratricopeptide (TPR) repeat protein